MNHSLLKVRECYTIVLKVLIVFTSTVIFLNHVVNHNNFVTLLKWLQRVFPWLFERHGKQGNWFSFQWDCYGKCKCIYSIHHWFFELARFQKLYSSFFGSILLRLLLAIYLNQYTLWNNNFKVAINYQFLWPFFCSKSWNEFYTWEANFQGMHNSNSYMKSNQIVTDFFHVQFQPEASKIKQSVSICNQIDTKMVLVSSYNRPNNSKLHFASTI